MSDYKCFVIMPFSTTKSTSAKNWTHIYEKIIRPAVEDSGFGFQCKRAKATRGNIIKDIVTDLNESDIVIADMTDHNANVCYELGIRHGLNVGTILLAQNRKFLSIFDLSNYGSHVYNWKTKNGKKTMIEKIRELLKDYLEDPLRPDNPAQDFLSHKPSFSSPSTAEIKDIIEYDSSNNPQIVLPKKQLNGKLAVGLALLSNSKTGLTMNELVQFVSKNWKKVKSTDMSPILSQQMSGLVLKEGSSGSYVYRLSKKGRIEILNMIGILKGKK
ncbi:hypothetical protein [Nitrosopumilus sp. S4]